MEMSISHADKITKDESYNINHTPVLPLKLSNTVDHSTGAIYFSGSSNLIDVDLHQTLVTDTSSLIAVGDVDDVDDISWYFDSNDENLEESQTHSTSDHDCKPFLVDHVIFDNFETSISPSCSEDTSLDSPVNLTSQFEEEEESQSLMDGIAQIKTSGDTNFKSATDFRNILSTPMWSGTHAKGGLATSRNQPPVMSYYTGNSPVPTATKLNHRGKMYRTQFDDSPSTPEGERSEEWLQGTTSLDKQNVNALFTAGKSSRVNLPPEDTIVYVKAPFSTYDRKTEITKGSVTSGSLQELTKELDACLNNLKISKTSLSSRIPSTKQILLNSRHFQNGEMLPEIKVKSEVVNNVSNYGGSTSCIGGVFSGKHSTYLDVDQLDGSLTVEPTGMPSASTLMSPSSKDSRTPFESLFDSDAELVSGLKKRKQLLSQPQGRIFTNQDVPLETSSFKIKRQAKAVDGLNGVCNNKGNYPNDCLFQNSKPLCTSPNSKEDARKHVMNMCSSPSFGKIFQKRTDIEVSPEIITSNVSCLASQVSKSITDFNNLCEGLCHGAGTSMTLARDIFLGTLQSGQFEDPYICRVVGPTSDHSTVIDGLVLPCDMKLMTLASSLRGKPLKAVLINGDLTKNYHHAGFKGSFEVKVVVDSVKDIPSSPQKVWLEKVMGIIKKFQVSVVLVKGHTDPSLAEQCMDCGTLIIPKVPYSALQYLSSNTNTSMNSYFRDVTKDDICEGLYIDYWEAGWEATIRSLYTKRTAYVRLWGPCSIQTVMICAPSNPQLQSQEEKFLSSYHKLKDVWKTRQVCPGMGATEIKVMRRLEEYHANITPASENYDDAMKRKVTRAFQAGLEEFITWLVQNCRDMTKFDIKNCINHLVSTTSSDSKSIQDNLFPQYLETESVEDVNMESCVQTERRHMFNANIDKSDPSFSRLCDGYSTTDGNESVVVTDRISRIDTGDTTDTGDTVDTKDTGDIGDTWDTGDDSVSRSFIYDCFSSKIEAWQSAWNLIKLVMNIDSVITTGLSTIEKENYKDVIL